MFKLIVVKFFNFYKYEKKKRKVIIFETRTLLSRIKKIENIIIIVYIREDKIINIFK